MKIPDKIPGSTIDFLAQNDNYGDNYLRHRLGDHELHPAFAAIIVQVEKNFLL